MTIAGQNVSIAAIIGFVVSLCAAVPGVVSLGVDLIHGTPVDSATLSAVIVGVSGFLATAVFHEQTSSATGGNPPPGVITAPKA